MNKARYVEVMKHMFLTDGWREVFLPYVQQLRNEYVEKLCYNSSLELAQYQGLQVGVHILDQILETPREVEVMAAELVIQPDLGAEPLDDSKQPNP